MSWPHDQTWSESINFPGHNHTLEINADSYNQWIREVCPLIAPAYLADDAFEPGTQKEEVFAARKNKQILKRVRRRHSLLSLGGQSTSTRAKQQLGKFQLGVRTLPYYQWGPVDWLHQDLMRVRLVVYEDEYDCYNRGAVMFTGPVHIPILSIGRRPWMSLTPMEIYTLRSAIRVAKGNVLIAGLGMGWLTQRILENPKVTSVMQVELDKDIIDYFGEPLKNIYSDKLQLIHNDVYQYLDEVSINTFDTIIFDIWSKHGEAADDEAFQNIKDTHDKDNVWGWGDVESTCYDDDYLEYEDQDESGFENDLACWAHPDEPQQWWGLIDEE
jgi:SAM-dependent methyltransferase